MDGTYTLDFETSGTSLPVDEIIAAAKPVGAFATWHNDPAIARRLTSAKNGIRIVLAERVTKQEGETALGGFFVTEQTFLRKLQEYKTSVDEQFIRCIAFVHQDRASYFELPLNTLRALIEHRTEFLLAAWPSGGTEPLQGK